jgi:ribosomal protein S28E/S33
MEPVPSASSSVSTLVEEIPATPSQPANVKADLDSETETGDCRSEPDSSFTDDDSSAEVTEVLVRLEKRQDGQKFGLRVGILSGQDGLRIIMVNPDHLLDRWNQRNVGSEVGMGDAVTMVNGKTEAWAMMRELTTSSVVNITVCRANDAPPASHFHINKETLRNTGLVLKRTTLAGSFGMTECSVCMDEVQPDEQVVRFECGHGFHQRCSIRWMRCCATPTCPLCRSDMR